MAHVGLMKDNRRLPAAMVASVVDTLMSFEDLFDAVMGEGYPIQEHHDLTR
jgi:hypothetical protein